MAIGYRKLIPYMAGIVTGVIVVFSLCVLLSGALVAIMPPLEPYMRFVGAAYILWLAWKTLKTSYGGKNQLGIATSYFSGVMLQFVNAKGLLYSIMICTTFFADHLKNVTIMSGLVLFIALTTVAANSSWALFGTVIQKYMKNETLKKVINILLALALVYTALVIVELV